VKESREGRLQRSAGLIALLVVVVVIVSAAHYVTPTGRPELHALYRWFYHLPIILGAFWFGLRGGVGLSLLVSAMYLPHLFLHWHGGHAEQWFELALYNIVGWVTGGLSWQLQSERDRYRRAAEELDRAYDDLKVRTRDLLETEEQLRHADRLSALGKLSAALAHEVKTPLASIRGTAEILAGHTTPEEREEFSGILRKEVDRLNRVVVDFLDFARPKAAREHRANLNDAVSEVLRLVSREARSHGVAVEDDLAAGLPDVGVDPEQLRQVIMNLAVNAIQAQPDGGRVVVGTRLEGEEVVLTVADEGPGIPAGLAEEVFEPFFTTRERGTGLGLSIVKKILSNHGASIMIGGASGEGTTITARLPLAE
jgi:signal transduction histidine kinase